MRVFIYIIAVLIVGIISLTQDGIMFGQDEWYSAFESSTLDNEYYRMKEQGQPSQKINDASVSNKQEKAAESEEALEPKDTFSDSITVLRDDVVNDLGAVDMAEEPIQEEIGVAQEGRDDVVGGSTDFTTPMKDELPPAH